MEKDGGSGGGGRRVGRGSELLTEVHTQSKPYLSIVTTQHETRQRRERHLLMKVKQARIANIHYG